MTCEFIPMPSGGHAIICTTERAKRCQCGARARFLCDWKVEHRRSGTCDAPLCAGCATSPAHEKHLCGTHAASFEEWQAARAARKGLAQ